MTSSLSSPFSKELLEMLQPFSFHSYQFLKTQILSCGKRFSHGLHNLINDDKNTSPYWGNSELFFAENLTTKTQVTSFENCQCQWSEKIVLMIFSRQGSTDIIGFCLCSRVSFPTASPVTSCYRVTWHLMRNTSLHCLWRQVG